MQKTYHHLHTVSSFLKLFIHMMLWAGSSNWTKHFGFFFLPLYRVFYMQISVHWNIPTILLNYFGQQCKKFASLHQDSNLQHSIWKYSAISIGPLHHSQIVHITKISILTLIKGACQPLPNEGYVGDFSPTEMALLEKILQCPA